MTLEMIADASVFLSWRDVVDLWRRLRSGRHIVKNL